MSGGFLKRMAESSRSRCRTAKQGLSHEAIKAQVRKLPPPPRLAFSVEGFDLIAEIKPSSPSEGKLAGRDFSPERLAKEYVSAGAMALSVLTEPSRFDGSLELLSQVAAAASSAPVMRKDFLVEPYQVFEARLHGASGVLLILGMTPDENTRAMLEAALGLGMFALLEAFSEEELARAEQMARQLDAQSDAVLLGLNCRDLKTLAVDPDRFLKCDPGKYRNYRVFAESGIEGSVHAGELAARGWGGLLMGTALMRADNPGTLAVSVLAEGRRHSCAS